MKNIQVIPATMDDLPEIARIHADCWRECYGFLPKKLINQRNKTYRMAQWKDWMHSPGEAECLFMIRCGQLGIGFCFARPSQDCDAPAGAGELHAGYLLQPWRGSSAGPGLMLTTAKFLEEHGRTPLVLWVFRQNPVRIWYAQMGWKKFIERHRFIEGTGVPEYGYISPPPQQLYHRLTVMIGHCDARGAGPRKKRSFQSARRPRPADSDTIPGTGLRIP